MFLEHTLPSPIHPLLGLLIAILQLGGTVFLGRYALHRFFLIKSDFVGLLLGMILVSWLMYIFSLRPVSLLMVYPIAIILVICGSLYYYQKIQIVCFKRTPLYINKKLNITNLCWLVGIVLCILFFLSAIGPPTMTDALDYHWGVPIYLLRWGKWPITDIWLHGSLAGWGEIYNMIGMEIGRASCRERV